MAGTAKFQACGDCVRLFQATVCEAESIQKNVVQRENIMKNKSR